MHLGFSGGKGPRVMVARAEARRGAWRSVGRPKVSRSRWGTAAMNPVAHRPGGTALAAPRRWLMDPDAALDELLGLLDVMADLADAGIGGRSTAARSSE
jgi:hypothetical protein